MLRRREGKPLLSARLVYVTPDRAFDVVPTIGGGFTSLTINEVQIEVDDSGILLYVWGYCPRESWLSSKLEIAKGKQSRGEWFGEELAPGVSRELNPDSRWPVQDAQLRALWLQPELN